MIKVLLNGCLGKMGHAVEDCINERENVVVSCGVDIAEGEKAYPVYTCFVDVQETPDVIIDFSNPLVLDDMLSFALRRSRRSMTPQRPSRCSTPATCPWA